MTENGITYGYARCSTNEELQNIDRQYRDLKAMGVTDDKYIYSEYVSGVVRERKELEKLFDIVKPGDTIVTTEVSRLTRSTAHLCEILETVQAKKLRLKIGNSFDVDCRTEDIDLMTKGMLMMWGVFAELEHDMISQRVKSGMANAKEKGVHVGRNKMTADMLPNDFWRYYAKYLVGELTVTEISRLLDCSRGTVYNYIALAEQNKDDEVSAKKKRKKKL